MKIHRIWGLIRRYFYYFRYSADRQTDMIYWPIIDLLLWGLTSSYFKSISNSNVNIILSIITGLVLWQIVWRGQYEITVNLLEEIWRYNLLNIFGSPVRFSEWTVAVLFIGFIKAIFSFTFGALVAFILYKTNIFTLGWLLLPFGFLLMMSGWWVGFIISGVILRYTSRVQTLAWSGIYLLAPFSAAFYPLSVLPVWAQKIASIVPMSYIFEGMRKVINTGSFDWYYIWASLFLNVIYLIASYIFLRASFDCAMDKGLNKVI